VARTSFSSPDSNIVVSSDGYFDVYPPIDRSNGDKPAYRGRLAELGAGLRGPNDRLAVRPGSVALADAVSNGGIERAVVERQVERLRVLAERTGATNGLGNGARAFDLLKHERPPRPAP